MRLGEGGPGEVWGRSYKMVPFEVLGVFLVWLWLWRWLLVQPWLVVVALVGPPPSWPP